MDCNREPRTNNATSLQDLYTDFDSWVQRYNQHFARFQNFSKETILPGPEFSGKYGRPSLQDVLIADILLKQMPRRHTARNSMINNNFHNKKNENFVFYDSVLYKLMDYNKRILYQYKRCKL